MAQRYIKPKNVREAMELIQDLFNKYRHEPLTEELLRYHQGLTSRLQSDIYQEAILENNPCQLKQLQGMIGAMNEWTKLRTANKPFNGKMKNFKLTSTNHQKIKRLVRKARRGHNYHVSHH